MMIKSTLSKSSFMQQRLLRPQVDRLLVSPFLSLSLLPPTKIRFFSSIFSSSTQQTNPLKCRQFLGKVLLSKDMKLSTTTMTMTAALQKEKKIPQATVFTAVFGNRTFSDNNNGGNNNSKNNNRDGSRPNGDDDKNSKKSTNGIGDIFDQGGSNNSGGGSNNVEELFRISNSNNNQHTRSNNNNQRNNIGGPSNIFPLRRTPEQEEKLNRQYKQQQVQERQRFLRNHAIQLFPGNYEDDEDYDYSDGMTINVDGVKNYNQNYLTPGHPRGREDKERKIREDKEDSFLYDSDEEREEELSKLYKAQHEEESRKKQKWIENSKPPVRFIQIDERGRAYGRGGRKTAKARVWIQPGDGYVVVNKREFTEYFERESDRVIICEPFLATNTCCKFDVTAMVNGGGLTGQAGAIRLGVARALQNYNPKLYRAPLKKLGFLKRDPRKVERKKIGRVKARKRPQWVKR